MSNAEPACIGKLPFNLLDELQSDQVSTPWMDAVSMVAHPQSVNSIDTVALDSDDLPTSVQTGILHAMNDVFAASAIPNWFALSMVLPRLADLDLLRHINSRVSELAVGTDCEIGKLHTIRADGLPFLTTCVGGGVQQASSRLSESGSVVIYGDWERLNKMQSAKAVADFRARAKFCTEVSGPKKDVSGDGLAGTLVQISRREGVVIHLWDNVLANLAEPDGEWREAERNLIDYAPSLIGVDVDVYRRRLFMPFVFGPILCLADKSVDLKSESLIAIGSFERGTPQVRVDAQ